MTRNISFSLVSGSLMLHLIALTTLLLVILSVFFALLCIPPQWKIDIGAAGDVRFIEGFYRYEYDGTTTFRWSSPESRLLLYGASAGLNKLSLRMHSNQPTKSHECAIQLQSKQHKVAAFNLLPGWRVYQVFLPTKSVAEAGFDATPLTLTTSTYDPDSQDGRELGIPLDWIELEHVRGVSDVLNVPFQRALLLMWGLAICAGMFWFFNHALLTKCDTTTAIRHLSIQIAGVALILALWIWMDPFVFAWAWSVPHNIFWVMTCAPLAMLVVYTAGFSLKFNKLIRLSLSFRRVTSRNIVIIGGGIWIVAHLLVFLVPLPVSWQGSIAWLLLMGLPGALLVLWFCQQEQDILECTVLAFSGGIILPPLLLLAIHALPGPAPWWLLLLSCDAITIASTWLLWKRRNVTSNISPPYLPHPTSHIPPIIFFILILAGMLRLPFLGNHEFQGDEGQVMIMATGLLNGQDDILMVHRKGPMEILLVGVPMVLTHHINEWVARLPFAIAGMASVFGCFVVVRRIFHSPSAGLIAAMLLALDGFLIGFSRIVQYQNIVNLMLITALWLCWRFYEQGTKRYISLAAFFVAVALLSHYDAIFALPALVWLAIAGARQHKWNRTQWVRGFGLPIVICGTLLCAFYIPFVQHEHFARTVQYLLTMRIGERDKTGVFFNNLPGYYSLMTFYNTVFHIQTLAIMLATAILVWLCRYGRPRWIGYGLATLFLVGCGIIVWSPTWFQRETQMNWAIVALGFPIVGLALFPKLPLGLRIVTIWFGCAYLSEAFLIAQPNTHFYTMHFAAAILIGVFVIESLHWLRHRHLVWILSPAIVWGIILFLINVHYLFLIFIQQYPEYKRAFPRERPNLYVARYGDKTPTGGYFGFPQRDGWKVIEELYRDGTLQGSYTSNQKAIITTWYIRHTPRSSTEPMYYFAVRAKGYLFIPKGYHPFGSILVDGIRMMDIYTRTPLTQQPYVFALNDHIDRFDNQSLVNFPIQWQFLEIEPHQITTSDENDE